ncbi:MAG: type II secretion system protein GspG [Verrucomicrobiota bacterium]
MGLLFPRVHVFGGRAKAALAKAEVSNLNSALRTFYSEIHHYPSGTSGDVMRALVGENPKRLKFFSPNPKLVNSRGEYMDPWQTPYQINIIGQTNYIIRSAGPNRIFGDKDDLTNSAPPNAAPHESANSATNPVGKIGTRR